MIKVAIMVDGGFYKKQSYLIYGDKTPEERADELVNYCMKHIKTDDKLGFQYYLYRIFYYDCPPAKKNVYHPLTQKNVNLEKTDLYKWNIDFFQKLVNKRKVALRMGELLESTAGYTIKPDVIKKLCRKEITIDELTDSDFKLDIQQKGVDMRIGLDISSLANKKLVDKIVLIAGDSDFVPAAKYARREGIDFVLDPMWHNIKPSLNEHIDGLKTFVPNPTKQPKTTLDNK